MSRISLSKWATFAAIAMILPGCGTSTGLLAAQTNGLVDASADANGKRGFEKGPRGDHGPGLPGLDLADLALTADQQTALKAVMDKYKPAAPAAKPSADPGKDLRAAVLADKVDDAALRAAIAAMEANKPARPQVDRAAMLTEIRAILTADQRAKLVAKLQAAPTRPRPSGDPRADMLAKLNLSAAQKAAVDALDAARKPAGNPDDRRTAMIAFWQNGDASGLAEPTPPAFPVEPFVAAVEILDATQRQALFGHEGHGFGREGHGFGREGHGFGPGGPGGPGGRHGRRGPDGGPEQGPPQG
jgi:Spy/CpxP family protein refolding chaperone